MEIKIQKDDEVFVLNKFAKQANGAVLYQRKKLVILATVVTQEETKIEGDFLPLTVQYIEKSYAAKRFPKGYIKREGKPNEFEVLTSRLIDRSLRPLFPKSYRYPVQITITTLSIDDNIDIQTSALNAASVALMISNIPINKPINCVRIGKINDKFIINPNIEQIRESSIDLLISGESENLAMIEFQSNREELSEEAMLDAIALAQEHISKTSLSYKELFTPHIRKPIKLDLQDFNISKNLFNLILEHKVELENILREMSKSENSTILNAFIQKIVSNSTYTALEVEVAITKFKRDFIRKQILDNERRLDGRGLRDIRKISIETNLLPNTHGSALFTRGETQVLAICTIGNDNDMQSYEMLTAKSPLKTNFIFHYNFPSFSTGEAYPISSPTRRELGHGNLARKALKSSICDESRSIRVVSEVLESNGSSSMASVCGGSLSLYAAGLQPKFLVAGIAMGLVKEDSTYKILTDIMGIEDYDGDMDFKVAGNSKGITALQMDIKIDNISHTILKDALFQAKEARMIILEKMERAKDEIILSDEIERFESFKIPINKIPSIIGQGGRNIREIIERFCVNIDINKELGVVNITGTNEQNIVNAKEYILSIVFVNMEGFNIGDRFSGRIKRKADFGIFVELKNGIDGLIHNSKLLKNNIDINDFSEGDNLEVEIIAINNDKIELYLV